MTPQQTPILQQLWRAAKENSACPCGPEVALSPIPVILATVVGPTRWVGVHIRIGADLKQYIGQRVRWGMVMDC